jgi:hypothetical protein
MLALDAIDWALSRQSILGADFLVGHARPNLMLAIRFLHLI